MATDERLLLRVDEVAQRLALGRTKTYDLLAAGELRSVCIGRTRRVSVAALEEFIARLAEQADAQRTK